MSKPLRVVIADDENLARMLIKEYLRPHTDLEIIAECETGTAAVNIIETERPDLLFLDIQIPELTGLEVLEVTGRLNGVIFTTAYDQYALKAFDLHAIDYLLKPISQKRFNEALEKAKKLLSMNALEDANNIRKIIARNTDKNQQLQIRDRGQIYTVPISSIDYIKAEDDYVLIHAAGQVRMKTQTLSDMEEQLNCTTFVRIHRSYLLNLKALKCIERQGKDSMVATLLNGEKLPVSRSGYERLKLCLV